MKKGLIIGLIVLVGFIGYYLYKNRPSEKTNRFTQEWVDDYGDEIKVSESRIPVSGTALLILQGAKECARNRAQYTPGYFEIDYPMGDLPPDQGVCTDVVIRSFRNAGIDLQELIHRDMKQHFKSYPQIWGLKKANTNIDHRRTPNQMCFFRRHGKQLTLKANQDIISEWCPGNIIYWRLDNGLLHCGIISDRTNPQGIPFVIHNICETREEDCLTSWKIIAHFKYPVN